MSEFFPPVNRPGLFTSAAWINAWIDSWGDHPAIKPMGPCPATEHHALAGSCILYSYNFSPLPLLAFKTLFVAGSSTPAANSLRSEYFMPPDGGIQSLIDSALHYSWSQLWIPDLLQNSVAYTQLQTAAQQAGLQLLVRDTATAYAVNLQQGGFTDYLQALGSNTRLKLFNKRKRLYETGAITIKNIWPDIDNFIDILNGFHQTRWGKPCYQGRNRAFIVACMNNLVAEGGEVDLSVIYRNGQAISVVLDIRYRHRIYNIQSGFQQNPGDGISLGTLHFGFQIEKAFNSSATFYDFMAGNGKNSNYKAALATQSDVLVSVMLVRSTLLKLLYSLNDHIKPAK